MAYTTSFFFQSISNFLSCLNAPPVTRIQFISLFKIVKPDKFSVVPFSILTNVNNSWYFSPERLGIAELIGAMRGCSCLACWVRTLFILEWVAGHVAHWPCVSLPRAEFPSSISNSRECRSHNSVWHWCLFLLRTENLGVQSRPQNGRDENCTWAIQGHKEEWLINWLLHSRFGLCHLRNRDSDHWPFSSNTRSSCPNKGQFLLIVSWRQLHKYSTRSKYIWKSP